MQELRVQGLEERWRHPGEGCLGSADVGVDICIALVSALLPVLVLMSRLVFLGGLGGREQGLRY